ncbi:hypothetical protein J6590_024823 [Homalodisca vitripennis]|nr:hypothetical protein J6590_024823 [Homalodisca vitripennis]
MVTHRYGEQVIAVPCHPATGAALRCNIPTSTQETSAGGVRLDRVRHGSFRINPPEFASSAEAPYCGRPRYYST